MAFSTTMWCPVCKQKQNVIISHGKPRPVMCTLCEANKENINKQNYLENLKKENLYDRLGKIEEWIYDHKKEQKIDYNINKLY